MKAADIIADAELGSSTKYQLYNEESNHGMKSGNGSGNEKGDIKNKKASNSAATGKKTSKTTIRKFDQPPKEPTSPGIADRISSFNAFSLTGMERPVDEEKKPKRQYYCTAARLARCIEIILVLGFIVLLAFVLVGFANIYHIVEDTEDDYIAGSGPLVCNLIGDSLFNKPYHMFDLPNKMNYFVNYQFTINDYAISGQCIAGVLQTLPPALDPLPDTVLLFWDSDISNYDEYTMTVEQIYIKRQYYVSNLTAVINTTLNAGVKYMAVGGPGFLGEGYFLKKHYFWHKVDQLNDYRVINEEVTRAMNVTYINVRHKYLTSLPWYWPYFQWYITIDGEHENARGTRFVSKLFGQTLQRWLQTYNASLLNN